MKLKLAITFTFLSIACCFAQMAQLSSNSEISVLTIGPGESLNDAFGHNAFRIKDNNLGIDAVYGYGQYDFDAPNFYLKFAQGKLNYLISRHNFADIYYHYTNYNRTIEELVLNLTLDEKQRLFDVLEHNYQPENRGYLYDFFFDNCATKIRDVTLKATQRTVDFKTPTDFKPKTFRSLIHDHVGLNTWGSFGIDIALGSVIDHTASVNEHMFLPFYINAFFETATLNGTEKLVKTSKTVYQKKQTSSSILNFIFSPILILGILGLGILWLTYRDYKTQSRTVWLDVALFNITGLVGIVLLLLWFATDHSATAYNYNLLWAMPLNILVLGQLFRPVLKNWFKRYIKFLIIMLVLMTFHWISGVQVFAVGIIPLIIALFVRYIFLVKHSTHH
ncbi:DUF4105 domain-containing protein [Winogradskyella eckloniae]|uniref:lipoprotein N-acyltransferase Lnb domain-containing protein n=1 Tax=Winogradskyella eckloniae TaxID=1089306 RepID=UPI0015670957|nr:DUF4105 domain-containing protein [Winogradskyella eckloniae]NRD20537.1 DUF4105 domain-containing protein [Winogradskyella eckloniae]